MLSGRPLRYSKEKKKHRENCMEKAKGDNKYGLKILRGDITQQPNFLLPHK